MKSSAPVYDFSRGDSPILVSMPHVGILVPEAIRSRMTMQARQLPDTDWDVHCLYDFLPEIGASTIRANYSRYVVDLNRAPAGESLYPGQRVTEICPTTLFDACHVYMPGNQLTEDEVARRVEIFWQPYHQKIEYELERIRAKFGYAILWDAHSIKSVVPALFEGSLPDFNWGTGDGTSCAAGLGEELLAQIESGGKYSAVLNGRFKGGYITRHYGDPENNVHAIQLELSQSTYMSNENLHELDNEKVAALKQVLKQMIKVILSRFA